MSWLNSPPYSLDEANARGADVYEVIYRNWGYGEVSQWPPVGDLSMPISLAGIAIGPRSTVDRCWISYNLQKDQRNAQLGIINRLRRVSVGSPLLFSQPAAQGTKNDPTNYGGDDPLLTMTHKGSLYVWSESNGPSASSAYGYGEYTAQVESTRINGDTIGTTDSYIDINGVTQRMVGDPQTNVKFVGPQLHLLLFLKAPIIAPSIQRMPLKAAAQITAAAGGERLIANIATYGRRNVHVMMSANQACTFRLGAIRVCGTLLVGNGLPLEEPFDTSGTTPIAANTPTVLASCNQEGVYADWINLYATPSADADVTYVVSAYD